MYYIYICVCVNIVQYTYIGFFLNEPAAFKEYFLLKLSQDLPCIILIFLGVVPTQIFEQYMVKSIQKTKTKTQTFHKIYIIIQIARYSIKKKKSPCMYILTFILYIYYIVAKFYFFFTSTFFSYYYLLLFASIVFCYFFSVCIVLV